MAIMDEMSNKLKPHTDRIAGVLHEGMRRMEDRISDLGKPDTGDNFIHYNFKGKVPAGARPLSNTVGGAGENMPRQGEIWLFQSICVNGQPIASPTFTIRTNTGRLIAAVVKEGMGMETPGGDVVIFYGERLEFIPSAEGEYDFTVSFKRRKMPRPIAPNAIGGISQERADRPSHGNELAERQLQQVPWSPDSPWHGPTSPDGMPGGEEYGGEIDPSGVISGEPEDTEPET